MTSVKTNRQLFWLLLALLVGTTAVVFAPVGGFEATNYDDPNYVFENPGVLQGLSWDGVQWAFTTGHAANWHPVTWLSHQADVELFGPAPGPHHLVSLALHCVNVALLFALLCRLTGAVWRAALVAALFGWHPLHVESVAWIAERKDVLSGCFGLLTLLAYTKYAEAERCMESPDTSAARSGPWKSGPYWLAILCFALGLMSKPMLVTLPVVMLLLDFWPLRRGSHKTQPDNETTEVPIKAVLGVFPWRQLLIEKIPFFTLALISSIITILVQKEGGAVQSVESFSLAERIANALTSTWLYLEKAFWPLKLAAFYPLPSSIILWKAVAAGILLLAISGWVLATVRRTPHRTVGWFWFLVMLAPVIGIIQVGMQQMADRYTYLPLIGIFVFVTWEAGAWMQRLPGVGFVFAPAAGAMLLACAFAARTQVRSWHDSGTLFRHALEVTENNYLAHQNLGYYQYTLGDRNGAIIEYEAALKILPTYADAHSNLGRVLADLGRYPEAAEHLQAVLRQQPEDVIANNNLGNVLAILGRHEEAIDHFRAALAVKPDHISALNNWALSAEALNHPEEAIVHYREALRLNPNLAAALNNLAWLLATYPDDAIRNGPEALELAGRACQATDCSQPTLLLTLAAAQAECGQFGDATSLANQGLETARTQNNEPAIQRATAMLAAFQNHKAFRNPSRSAAANPPSGFFWWKRK